MNQNNQWLLDFGARLKAEREKQSLTQQALAGKAYTKQDYIAQIERGARNPSLRTLMNILSALDVSADYLIYGVGKEHEGQIATVLNDFVSFVSRRGVEDITAYYEIVRFMSKYVENDGK